MELTHRQTVQVTASLLLILVATQAVYTALFVLGADAPWPILWGLEGVVFTILAAFAGAAMVQANRYQLGWAAIAFSAVLNLVQASIGGTLFGPFQQAASQLEKLEPAAGGVVALAFMIYYAAKLLIGVAALDFGLAKRNVGSKVLGGLTATVGVLAIATNAILMVFGREGFLPSQVAGVSGVFATLLLAICLLSDAKEV